jgi:hypothetical protein
VISIEREDRITYAVYCSNRGALGTVTKLGKSRWAAENDSTGEFQDFPTLKEATAWLDFASSST